MSTLYKGVHGGVGKETEGRSRREENDTGKSNGL